MHLVRGTELPVLNNVLNYSTGTSSSINCLFFWRYIVDLSMCQTGAGVRRNTIICFHRKIITEYLFSYWVVAGTLSLVFSIEGMNEAVY